MAIEIKIPRLGWSMDEGIFAGWLKHDGSQFARETRSSASRARRQPRTSKRSTTES